MRGKIQKALVVCFVLHFHILMLGLWSRALSALPRAASGKRVAMRLNSGAASGNSRFIATYGETRAPAARPEMEVNHSPRHLTTRIFMLAQACSALQ